MNTAKVSYNIQKKLTVCIVALFVVKIVAWYITHSIAILTDALEYTINVVSCFIGLYSLRLSTIPRDENHPYGHGKVEFLSAAIEGLLMIISSFLIIYEAINNLNHPHHIARLDYGMYLIIATAIANYILGYYSIQKGKKNNSLALIASGKHMQIDTYATIGVIIGLILLFFTKYIWIDSVVALTFALLIIITGYKILRHSIAGIMDEADKTLLAKVVKLLDEIRKENWIDLHNLRIIKYGSVLHLDCHLTVPWYLNVVDAHKEVETLEQSIRENFGDRVELFVHTDACLDFSCKICTKKDCTQRKFDFIKKINWTVKNISTNDKHRAD
mgnify:CR=1 FL=1